MFGVGDFWLETRVIIKISTILATQETLTDFHGDEAKKKKKRILIFFPKLLTPNVFFKNKSGIVPWVKWIN